MLYTLSSAAHNAGEASLRRHIREEQLVAPKRSAPCLFLLLLRLKHAALEALHHDVIGHNHDAACFFSDAFIGSLLLLLTMCQTAAAAGSCFRLLS